MADNDLKNAEGTEKALSRREFITGVGGIGVGALFGGFIVKGFFLPCEVMALPASGGYLLVDTKKCAGCETCMLSCSMVHHGRVNPALSRIQITKNPFGKFPYDMEQVQCRQCPAPACVEACPTGANHVSAENGNVRMVDESKCIGCERCVYACPFTPSRVQWDPKQRKAQKCDLCKDTPFMSSEGGVGGMQACVAVCPTGAISFTKEVPIQNDRGYQVNLRKNATWATLGMPTMDDGSYDPNAGAAAAGGGH